MATKFFKSLFCAVTLLFSLGISNAWAGGHGGPHYATVTAKSTGNGKVYLTATNNYSVKDSEWQPSEMSTSWNCGDNSENDTKTYYFHAKANDGYVFAGWSTSESTNTKTYTSTPTGISTTASGTSAPGQANTYYAHFWQPMVGTAVCPDDINVSLKGQSGTATVTFNVSRAVAVGNFTGTPTLGSGFTIQSGPTISSLDGNGAGTVSYVLQYTAGATHGESSATIELNSNYNSTSAFCTVNANFPNITISGSDPEVPVFDVMPTEVVEGTAEFDVEYAATDGSEFVQWPLVPVVTSGYSGWTITSCTFAAGKVTVNYSFDPNGNYGNHSATLTLAATAAAGGASKTLNLGVVINVPSDKAAVVTLGGYEKEWDTFAEALTDANSREGCTLKLLNDCEVNASQAFTKSMTLDLNGFELKRSGITAAGEAILLNTSGKTLYITDTKPGAKGSIAAVASSSVAVTGIRVGNGCKLMMDKGTINVTTPGATARGIYSTTTPTSENMVVVSDVTINTTAASQSIGIDCASSSATDSGDPEVANVILSNVTINAETSGTTEAYAIRTAKGVALLVNSGTYNATAKTTTAYTLSTSGYTAIVNGTFNATAVGKIARAIHVVAGITAVKNGTFTATATTEQAHATYVETGAKLLVYGGTFRGECTEVVATAWATGTLVKGALEAQGGTFIGEISKPGLSAAQKSYAAGMYVYSGSNVSLANTTLRGEMKSTYLTNGGSSEWVGGAYGVYSATTNPLAITNSTLTAISAYQGGFAIRLNNTPVEIKNSTLTVNTTYAYNYGIFTQGTADVKVENSTITAVSGTTYAYGAYVYGGTLLALNSTFNATTQRTGATSAGDCNLFGINVYTGKTATLNGCTINATGSGQYSNNGYGVYVNGTADIEDCNVTVSNINSGAYAIGNTANTTRIGVASGKFKATATTTGVSTNGTAAAAKQQLYGGYYNTNTNLAKYLPTGYSIETLPTSAAEYAEGYRYAIRPGSNLSPVCKIGATPYYSLEEALEYANKNSGTTMTILMVANYTLPAGNYTLPAKASLLVPRNASQTALETNFTTSTIVKYNEYTTPSAFRTLTFASGVHLDVKGTIQVASLVSSKGQMNGQNGTPSGPHGKIVLQENSKIVLESGAKIYAWGYITGPGMIDAKNGSSVYECMQIRDWRGGTNTRNIYSKVFPFNQYFIQNIESRVRFRPGAEETIYGAVNASSSAYPVNAKLIGTDGAMFLMSTADASEDTWVQKSYDFSRDYQVYEVNSAAKLNSLTVSGLPLVGSVSTSSYNLPLVNNMHIHLLTGKLEVIQSLLMQPGVIIEIDKEAKCEVASGKKIYVQDSEDTQGYDNSLSFNTIPYSPQGSVSGKRTLTDASINMHGTFEFKGYLYTSEHGANIFSTNEDAGTIIFKNASPDDENVNICNTGGTVIQKSFTTPQLKNADGETPAFTTTSGSVANDEYAYSDNQWRKWESSGCFTIDKTDNSNWKYYAKPAEYVQLTSNVADGNHLYHDAATGSRAFIVEDGCIWWEVEPTPYDGNKYKCVDPDYDGRYKYYEYVSNKWQEATVTITWKNGSTTLATYSNALYGVRPTYLDATPTKSVTSTEYYTWLGWTKGSTDGEFFAKDAELPEANENITYYAYFETHKYSYAVLFKNYDGSVLQTSSWEHGQVPYYSGEEPKKPATAAKEYAFTGWSPASFSAVTGGGSVYTAQFAESDRQYNVQWVNYDGTVLKEEQVAYGSTPSEPVTPTRPNDSYYTYTFDAWSPDISAVIGNQTYTATYNYEKKVTKYTINFKNGSTTLYSQSLPSGETPVYDGSTPTKEEDAEYTYSFDGWSATEGGSKLGSLPAVTGNANYFALFTHTPKRYTIRWKSEDGKVLYETDTNVPYGSIPSYDGAAPTKARVGSTVYTFDGWSATIGGAKIALSSVTGDATYYAHFSDNPVYTVTFNANGHGTAPSSQGVVENQHVIEPAAPAAAEWIFGGWYKEAECTNAWNFASDVVTANRTLYAKWTPAVASVTANEVTSYYTTVTDAIAAANGKTNAIVTMLQNASVTSEVEITAAMTIDLNGKTISSTETAATKGVFKINAEGMIITITDNGTDGKISHVANCAGYLYGINLFAGSLNVEGGYIYAENTNATAASTNRACGIMYANDYTNQASLTVSDGTIEAKRASTYVYGISIYTGNCGLTMTGGTVKASGGNGVVRGIYTQGTAVLSNVTVTATATITGDANCYAVFSDKTGNYTINSGTYTATSTSTGTNAYALSLTKSTSSAGGSAIVNGGRFSGKSKELNISGGTASLKGGYYVHKTDDLEDNCAENYHVLDLAGEDPYKCEVAEAYTLTWNLDGGTVTTAGTQAPVDATGTPSGYVAKGATLTAPVVEKTGFTFDGWTPVVAATMPAANTTYTATWETAETGDLLDIVGATSNTLTINANPLTLSKWPYTINETSYGRDGKPGPDEQCNADRTITISHDKGADEELLITVLDKNSDLVSRHRYIVPHVYSSENATLSGTNENSIVFVNSGKLTVNSEQYAKVIYVSEDAELDVKGTLHVDKLVLRTVAFKAAVLTNEGTIDADHIYYSRKVADNSQFYLFGLPLPSTTSGVILSDGSTPSSTSWQLKEYSESSRATNGIGNETSNWSLISGVATIEGGKGYEIFSASKYYREYYFPVSLDDEEDEIPLSYTGNDPVNSGWNVVTSLRTGIQENKPAPEGITISVLQPDGGYEQVNPTSIKPAVPFSYQASAGGKLAFESDAVLFVKTDAAPAPRRRVPAAEEKERIQWIHLDVKDADGEGDQTSIYSHPTRYEQTYKTGIDVAKQSLTASRAIIYSSHAYGEMAFAGVADALLEQGVALTVYSPAAQELTISMRENDWLNRMEYVWLIDNETGMRINLLNSDYTFDAAAGTTSGRFFIRGQFKAPNTTTDIRNGAGIEEGARKVLIDQKIYIEVNGRLYDATGKIVSK